jgi:hypothetical protein
MTAEALSKLTNCVLHTARRRSGTIFWNNTQIISDQALGAYLRRKRRAYLLTNRYTLTLPGKRSPPDHPSQVDVKDEMSLPRVGGISNCPLPLPLIGVDNLQHCLMFFHFFVFEAAGDLQFFLRVFLPAKARVC